MSKEVGKVIWFDRKKGFGFVKLVNPDSELYNTDVFVHFTSIVCESDFKLLYPGEYISLDVKENTGDDGKKYTTENITGLYGTALMVDNKDYLIKVIRKRKDENEESNNVEDKVDTDGN